LIVDAASCPFPAVGHFKSYFWRKVLMFLNTKLHGHVHAHASSDAEVVILLYFAFSMASLFAFSIIAHCRRYICCSPLYIFFLPHYWLSSLFP
jgi:hypothetical protein